MVMDAIDEFFRRMPGIQAEVDRLRDLAPRDPEDITRLLSFEHGLYESQERQKFSEEYGVSMYVSKPSDVPEDQHRVIVNVGIKDSSQFPTEQDIEEVNQTLQQLGVEIKRSLQYGKPLLGNSYDVSVSPGSEIGAGISMAKQPSPYQWNGVISFPVRDIGNPVVRDVVNNISSLFGYQLLQKTGVQ